MLLKSMKIILLFCFCTEEVGSSINNDNSIINEIEILENDNSTLSLETCNGPGSDPFRNFAFNGQCYCKRNVEGTYCLDCKRNTYDMSFKHQHGCIRCFCSGLSKKCNSSDYWREKLQASFESDGDGVTLVYPNLSEVDQELMVDSSLNEIYVENLSSESNRTYYWKLPEKFLGEKLTSYGGFINFTINYEHLPPQETQPKWLKDPLIFMQGNGITLYYRFRKRNRKTTSHFLSLVENNWFKLRFRKKPSRNIIITKGINAEKTMSSQRRKSSNNNNDGRTRRKRAKRRDMMRVLANIDFILIKANYKPLTTMVGMRNLSMSYAIPGSGTSENSNDEKESASSVEKCECPTGYGGLSCQTCTQGFTKGLLGSVTGGSYRRRSRQTSRALQCNECQCNGRANTCDPETGICIGCQNNSTGDHCQKAYLQCDPRGTFVLDSEEPKCKCKARVEGELCDKCRESHFHLDYENFKGCKKCWCSGVSLRCSSSSLRRFQIKLQSKSAISISFKQKDEKKAYVINFYNGKAKYRPFTKYRHVYKLHWSLPKIFTGNLLKSYGGYLKFSLTNRGHCRGQKYIEPLLELESFYGRILRWKFSPPIRMNSLASYSIKLVEDQFVYTFNYIESSRSTFLEVLKDLRSIRIYIPDCAHISSTEIGDIVLDTSTASAMASENPPALEVEQCDCSAAYSGLSCENCAPGYEFDNYRRCIRKSRLNFLRNF